MSRENRAFCRNTPLRHFLRYCVSCHASPRLLVTLRRPSLRTGWIVRGTRNRAGHGQPPRRLLVAQVTKITDVLPPVVPEGWFLKASNPNVRLIGRPLLQHGALTSVWPNLYRSYGVVAGLETWVCWISPAAQWSISMPGLPRSSLPWYLVTERDFRTVQCCRTT